LKSSRAPWLLPRLHALAAHPPHCLRNISLNMDLPRRIWRGSNPGRLFVNGSTSHLALADRRLSIVPATITSIPERLYEIQVHQNRGGADRS
jgi:hypothetical protein